MVTNHRVIFGDSAQVLRCFPENTFQLMVTSPPYWNARDHGHNRQIGRNDILQKYLIRLNAVWTEVVRTLLPDGKVAVNIGNIYYRNTEDKRKTVANLSHSIWKQLDLFKELRIMGTIFWRKSPFRNGRQLFGSYPYPSNIVISTALEQIHVFRKVGKRIVPKSIKESSKISLQEFRKLGDPLWEINAVSGKHCAIYPYELPRRLIKMFSFVGDTVLDPFVGSGTTMKAAKDLDRHSVGIDINSDFLPIIRKKFGAGERGSTAELKVEDQSGRRIKIRKS